MKDNIISELQKMKEEVEKKKTELLQLEGRKKEILRSLKRDYGFNSVEEAEKYLSDIKKKHEKISKSIEKDFNKLKEMYGW